MKICSGLTLNPWLSERWPSEMSAAPASGSCTGMPRYDSRNVGVRNAVPTMPRMVDCLLGWKRTDARGDCTTRFR